MFGCCCLASAGSGPLLYYSPHPADTASDPGHVDFDSALAVPVTLSKSKQDKLRKRADQVLDSLYPGVLSSVEHVHVHLPVLTGGAVVANTVEKYAAKLSAVTDIQVCRFDIDSAYMCIICVYGFAAGATR